LVIFNYFFVVIFETTDFSTAMAATISDKLENSLAGEWSKHEVKVELNSTRIINSGSLKIDFDDDFGFGSLLAADINVTGGDVLWQMAIINNIDSTIVIPFNGELNNLDGQLVLVIGDIN
jgi:hypothetical protein